MKLQTHFTVPNKRFVDLDYFKKKVLEETYKSEYKDYPTQEDCLVCFY